MRVKEIFLSRERKCNIGNYESVGATYGMTIELKEGETENEAYKYIEDYIEAKLKAFEDVWKKPQSVAGHMAKENMQKYNDSPF